MDTPPLVSVIIATYNWSSVLRYAIASVQKQSVADFELLVVGDGCTDDSGEVVASFHDPRFRWENLPANSGHQSAPNNRGLELARGRLIAYLGHDDLWMPNHLELLLREVERAEADVAFSLCIVVGAPGCDGRWLFGACEREFIPGSHLPPSALLHRKSLIDRSGCWSDYRRTEGSPETDLWRRFYESGARFVSVSEVTVFKFPSSWRPLSYQRKESAEQADFFNRMQRQPDFLHRELIELALAQELLRPHTTIAPSPSEHDVLPGATVSHFRRNRGLAGESPPEGAPRYLPSAPLARAIDRLVVDEMDRRQESRFAVFELIYAVDGHYTGARYERTLAPVGRWTRLLIPLEHKSEGGSLRFDPCAEPALIEIAWIALRCDSKIVWSLRGTSLAALRTSGDAIQMSSSPRILRLRSRGHDPMLFLPLGVECGPPMIFDCWIKISREKS